MNEIMKDVADVVDWAEKLRTRIILIVGGAVVAGVLALALAHHFEDKGRTLERADWLAKQVKEQQADAALVRKHEADMKALRDNQLAIERATSEKHNQELAQLRLERDADRAAVDRAGGLRIPAPACPAGGAVGATEAAGAGGRDDASGAGTVRLPQQIENDLWRIADDADELSAQLRACQGWIRANGFYGQEATADGSLLGKIADEQNYGKENQ